MPKKSAATASPSTDQSTEGSVPQPYVEIGSSGSRQVGGYILDLVLPELRGSRGRHLLKEMSELDAQIGAALFVIKMLFRSVTVSIEPGGTAPQDLEASDFVQGCLEDMSCTWSDVLSDILSFLPYGWAYLEQVYKRRQGDQGETRSRFADGKIGWRKWALRAQTSLERWEFDDTGGLQGMWQQPTIYGTGSGNMGSVMIPIQKSLLFTTEHAGGSPEGRSILLNSYSAYYTSKHIRTIESIGIQRDLTGMPVIRVPGAIMKSTAPPEEARAFEAYKQLGERINSNEQACVVLPSDRDAKGNYEYDLTLAGTGSRRLFDTSAVLERYAVEKLMPTLTDFIMVGHQATGTQGLHVDKTDLFGSALEGWMDAILAVPNRHEIPRLLKLNGIQVENPPQFKHGKILAPKLADIAAAIKAFAGAGMPLFPNDVLQNRLLEIMGMPPVAGSDSTTVGKRRSSLSLPVDASPGTEPTRSTQVGQLVDARQQFETRRLSSAQQKLAPFLVERAPEDQ